MIEMIALRVNSVKYEKILFLIKTEIIIVVMMTIIII